MDRRQIPNCLLCCRLKELGNPSPTRIFVFNGDYVDRGSWGVELLALLCCLKCALPCCVYLLRGNHESSTCTKYYGYSQEIRAKYEKQQAKVGYSGVMFSLRSSCSPTFRDAHCWQEVYAASKKLFSVMPLAALIQRNTLVMHGGPCRGFQNTLYGCSISGTALGLHYVQDTSGVLDECLLDLSGSVR
jgi:hypothetical protein